VADTASTVAGTDSAGVKGLTQYHKFTVLPPKR
jgi:hypothetical protein